MVSERYTLQARGLGGLVWFNQKTIFTLTTVEKARPKLLVKWRQRRWHTFEDTFAMEGKGLRSGSRCCSSNGLHKLIIFKGEDDDLIKMNPELTLLTLGTRFPRI